MTTKGHQHDYIPLENYAKFLLLRGDTGVPEIHVIQKEQAGRSKCWLEVRNMGRTLRIFADCSKYGPDIGNVD